MAISEDDFVSSKRKQFSSFTGTVFWVATVHIVVLALMAILLL